MHLGALLLGIVFEAGRDVGDLATVVPRATSSVVCVSGLDSHHNNDSVSHYVASPI